MKYSKLTMLLAGAALLTACNQSADTKHENTIKPLTASQESSALPAGHPPLAAATQQNGAQPTATNGGEVKEVFNAGGYTYASVENNGEITWVAGPKTELQVGQQVAWDKSMLMSNFKSPTLNRTFESIYFIAKFQQPGATPVNLSQGVVTETFSSAGYTYLKVKADDKDLWIAAPETEITNGAQVSWNGGAVMKNFKSASLDRVFDEIVFVDKITIGG